MISSSTQGRHRSIEYGVVLAGAPTEELTIELEDRADEAVTLAVIHGNRPVRARATRLRVVSRPTGATYWVQRRRRPRGGTRTVKARGNVRNSNGVDSTAASPS